MSALLINYEKDIVHIVLNRPEVRNALNKELLTELSHELESINKNSKLRAALFYSSSEKAFCAGADLKERAAMSEQETFGFVKLIQSTINKIALLKIPTIAAVNGEAFGGGLELALACDMRIGSEDIQLGLTECSLGIIPGAGGTQRLPKIVGISRAMEMIFMAKRMKGKEAYAIALLNELVTSRSEVVGKAQQWATIIANNAPLAIRAAKKALTKNNAKTFNDALAFELECYQEIISTSDRLEALRAFREKRLPQFRGE
ncbi:MAG: enoyl-CoA hydratase/isomerase family protein [Myxococcales bacterium]|nr:enoyl-CoA hydratase/isomerase family protein [Myxococcales bacterium]USN50693.1 MAG: enoyl-CoA hydratase/isomerase family protein [Myxococcales bacterium]